MKINHQLRVLNGYDEKANVWRSSCGIVAECRSYSFLRYTGKSGRDYENEEEIQIPEVNEEYLNSLLD